MDLALALGIYPDSEATPSLHQIYLIELAVDSSHLPKRSLYLVQVSVRIDCFSVTGDLVSSFSIDPVFIWYQMEKFVEEKTATLKVTIMTDFEE